MRVENITTPGSSVTKVKIRLSRSEAKRLARQLSSQVDRKQPIDGSVSTDFHSITIDGAEEAFVMFTVEP